MGALKTGGKTTQHSATGAIEHRHNIRNNMAKSTSCIQGHTVSFLSRDISCFFSHYLQVRHAAGGAIRESNPGGARFSASI